MSARPLGLLAAVLLGAGLAACHHAGSAAPPPPQCQSRADCQGGVPGGLLCTGGQCTGCTRSRDCRLQEVCDPVQRRCTLRTCFGDACQGHDQCPLGRFCVQGLCLDPAAPPAGCSVLLCGSDRDCNPAQRCNGLTHVCEQDLGCGASGAIPQDGGTPDSGSTSLQGSCPAGEVCNLSSGTCAPACSEATQAQVCGPLVSCKEGRCVQCAADGDCGPGLTCDLVSGTCGGKNACQGSRDCPVPLLCDRPTGSCTAARPPCTSNESCASDERCQSQSGSCVPGACLPDRFAPNSTRATAARLTAGSFPQLSLCDRGEAWFALALQSGDRVQVVSDADPLGSFDLQLYSPDGTLLDDEPLAVLAVAGQGGDHFLRARSKDAALGYGLRIDVRSGSACARNPVEPHPSPTQALGLGPGPHYDLALCPGEELWFLLLAPSSAGVAAQAALDPTLGGGLLLELYAADGTTMLARDATAASSPEVQAPASAGTGLLLRVRGLTEAAHARFDLTVRSVLP